jgi:hypothetical protein
MKLLEVRPLKTSGVILRYQPEKTDMTLASRTKLGNVLDKIYKSRRMFCLQLGEASLTTCTVFSMLTSETSDVSMRLLAETIAEAAT